MSFLRTLRMLVLGETWVLPLGVLVVVLAGLGLRALDAALWREAGGPLLLAAVVVVLLAGVARTSRR
ncbi:MAG: hypothetical protein JWO90_3001 [Solirubrobacterales bacterium]|nr:hypothetical protein [Solirubrobacterales bacterium]